MKPLAFLFGILLAPFVARAEIALSDFSLVGELTGDHADFTLTAKAKVDAPRSDSVVILAGSAALTSLDLPAKEHLRAEGDRFILTFDHRGEFPVQIKFSATVRQTNDWRSVSFRVASSVVQPVRFHGLSPDTKILFAGAARPERKGDDFVSFLPSDGGVDFSWREDRPESEGKLFYSTEMLAQISVRPGLMRQAALLNFKVMQGELDRVTLLLRGEGDVTRVSGDQVLSWNLEPGTNGTRRLVIQLNQPQKDQFSLQAVIETPLGAFPQTIDAARLEPENATRFAGYLRVANEGAVRIEASQTSGLSQISPEQFPTTDASRVLLRSEDHQRFAYRFAGGDFALRIAADQITPEVAASHLLTYHAGESELDIDDQIELDIREAPLRELALRIPKGYAVAKLNIAELRDYVVTEPPGETTAELHVSFGQPISGRQLLELRLENNHAAGGAAWELPRIDVVNAKPVRGQIGVTAEAGLRLAAQKTQGLTEMTAAFFPGQPAGLQAAFRLSDPAWAATLNVERLPQTMQVEAMHLFSIDEGIAYGSSVLNYAISGAPTATFRVALSEEYTNVEFTGKDIRSWQKTDGGYVVQLHSPAAGAYTMLASYERPFKSQGETLAFTGAQPLGAQSEQGYTLVISAYQFQVKPTEVTGGLLPLEPAEVPSQYRLYFDAPILAAYRYAARPFSLKLALSPLAQRESVNQIVDRASLETHIAKEGQMVTTARYFIKSRGHPNVRLTLPEGADLWSALINGAAVVPALDGHDRLIPLPQEADPNAAIELDLTLAAQSASSGKVTVAAPILDAPVMLEDWKLAPDTGRRLEYERGSFAPLGEVNDPSGFAQVAKVFSGARAALAWILALAAIGLAGLAMAAWRRQDGVAAPIVAILMLTVVLVKLGSLAGTAPSAMPGQIVFSAPVQQAGSALTVTVANLAEKPTNWDRITPAWPALLGVVIWLAALLTGLRQLRIAGWLCLAWAALALRNGGLAFFGVTGAFLLWRATAPGLSRLRAGTRSSEGGLPGAATAVLVGGLLLALNATAAPLATATNTPETTQQTVRVEDGVVFGEATLHWRAVKGQRLDLLGEPAVLTRISFPANALRLESGPAGSKVARELVALSSGVFDVTLAYQTAVANHEGEAGFVSPVPFGLVNKMNLTVTGLDVAVRSPQAVEANSQMAGTNTVASLVLTPDKAWIAWRPRSRDVTREKPVFYAELLQALAPTAGVVEEADTVKIRPAQGELDELTFTVPKGMTITDVSAAMVSLWRFDPDARKLRVRLNPAQSKPFALAVRAQIPSGPLPFEVETGVLGVDNAAGQIGLIGLATGNEVQLDAASGQALSMINLEDFPSDGATVMQQQIAGLAVRRAFRYSDPRVKIHLKASAVEPDVRVEAQQTLSLGEDRCALAATLAVDIERAGIFDLSFLAPEGYDVETISGAALSQWTEAKTAAGRLITMHLTGKTIGAQSFAINLAGPGVKSARGWTVPQINLREAAKQRGTLLLAPEQGMRMETQRIEGLTQLDPQKADIHDKGALLFQQLQNPSALSVNLEQVEPWVQVTSLQHAAINEAQVKVTANLQYQIENAGVKAFRILVPAGAQGVRFKGDQVGDFQAVEKAGNGWQPWLVSLRRRVIGAYLLQLTYEVPVARGATEADVRGVVATDVNLQRGFVTVQSDPRLQLTVTQTQDALQPAEWESIPRALQKDLQSATATYTYRLVESRFDLPLKLERHEAAKVLPAHVNAALFHSAISDDGVALTQAQLEIIPGDKRLLAFSLPANARFWFAFVNDRAVWPWRDGDNILIPLERFSDPKEAARVEIVYSAKAGSPAQRNADLELLAPKFELPLENVSWRVSMNGKWNVKHWNGTLELENEEAAPPLATADPQAYLRGESTLETERIKKAESFMNSANALLSNGDSTLARRAFEAAYGLSTHDQAFNEDARVQLHNIKVQQALMALNMGNSMAAGDAGELGAKLRDLRTQKEGRYTQQDAKDILDNNSADDNAAYLRLADKLIQQQDAATARPATIRPSIPEEARALTFKRAVVVDRWADLRIKLDVNMNSKTPTATRWLILGMTAAAFAGVMATDKRRT